MPQMPVPPMGGFPSIIPRFSVPPPGFPDFPPGAAPPTSAPTAAPGVTFPMGGAASEWSEREAPDGRIYYYSSRIQSSWQKPDALKHLQR
nr:unnamed protein product [Callosobruchus analis]